MNRINPEKLLQSKWTAVTPQHKEKHFIVIELLRGEQEQVTHCILQAVMTHREYTLDWTALKNDATWRMGWK